MIDSRLTKYVWLRQQMADLQAQLDELAPEVIEELQSQPGDFSVELASAKLTLVEHRIYQHSGDYSKKIRAAKAKVKQLEKESKKSGDGRWKVKPVIRFYDRRA